MVLIPFRIAAQASLYRAQQFLEHVAPPSDVMGWYDAVRENGLCVVENFLDRDACEYLVKEIRDVETRYPTSVHRPSNGADRRIFGANAGSSAINNFAHNAQLDALASSLLGRTSHTYFTLANIIDATKTNMGSGEGWHRDSFFGQFKALVYLTDVSEDNGPFQFILRSHKLRKKYFDRYLNKIPLHTPRITDDKINSLIAAEPKRLRTVTGAAGTIVLADTTGIHRGKPLRNGTRAALTNYYFRRRDVTPRLTNIFRPILGVHIPVS